MKTSPNPSFSRTVGLGILLLSSSLSAAAASPEDRIGAVVQPRPEAEGGVPLEQADYITAFSLLPAQAADASHPGLIGVMAAVVDKARPSPRDYRSAFDRSDVEATPGCFSVVLKDNQVKVDLATAGSHVAVYRFTFPESERGAHVVLDISHPLDLFRGGEVLARDRQTLEGFGLYQTAAGDTQKIFFSFQLSKSLRDIGVWQGETVTNRNAARVDDSSTLGFFGCFWPTHTGETILMKVGISTVSVDDARAKLNEEFPGWDFNQLYRVAKAGTRN